MEAVILRRVGFLAYCCPKQGQDFKPLAATLHPNMGQVPPLPRARIACLSEVQCWGSVGPGAWVSGWRHELVGLNGAFPNLYA